MEDYVSSPPDVQSCPQFCWLRQCWPTLSTENLIHREPRQDHEQDKQEQDKGQRQSRSKTKPR